MRTYTKLILILAYRKGKYMRGVFLRLEGIEKSFGGVKALLSW